MIQVYLKYFYCTSYWEISKGVTIITHSQPNFLRSSRYFPLIYTLHTKKFPVGWVPPPLYFFGQSLNEVTIHNFTKIYFSQPISGEFLREFYIQSFHTRIFSFFYKNMESSTDQGQRGNHIMGRDIAAPKHKLYPLDYPSSLY